VTDEWVDVVFAGCRIRCPACRGEAVIKGRNETPPIGLAVVGAGYWGPNLVRTALATPALRLKRLCDLDLERARAVLGYQTTVQATSSYEKVLDDQEIAAVAIATPAATHFELVSAALGAGKHVLVEKPLTASAAEAGKLITLARESHLALMCDHTYCYTPAVRQLREIVRGGGIGDIQFVDSVRINLGLVQPDVDVLWDLAPHDLSILDFVLPDDVVPIAVAAHTADPIGAGRACLAYLSVWLSNGALAHLHVNWLSPTKIRTTVFGGSKKTIVWDDMNPAARLAIHDRGVDRLPAGSVAADERRQALISYRIGDTRVPALPEREALMSVMAEFADAITARRQPLTDGMAGLRVLALLEAASQSAEYGGKRILLKTGEND
jgi:predicted dehydrogenase